MVIQFRRYWNLLVTYLKPQRTRVTLLTVLLFGSIGLQLVNPQIIRYFIDTTQAGGSLGTLFIAAGLFIAIALVQRVVAFYSTYVAENVGWTATNALRAELALHCLRLDMPFHKKRTPGEMIERIDGDVTALANFFSQFVIKAEEDVIGHFRTLNDMRRRTMLKVRLFREVLDSISDYAVTFGTGVTLLLAGQAMAARTFKVGDFALFVYYLWFTTQLPLLKLDTNISNH